MDYCHFAELVLSCEYNLENLNIEIETDIFCFLKCKGGISVQHLKGAAKAFCGIPAFLGQLLAKRINDLYGSLNST